MGVKQKLVEGEFLLTIRKRIDRGLGTLSRKLLFRKTPIQKNKILFMTYKNAYECNPKYIAEEILKQKLPYDLVWAIPKNEGIDTSQFPAQIRLVKRESYEFYQELASAKIWVDNSLNCLWMPFGKKREQVYFETWHGSMGLKRVGKEDVANERWLKAAKRVTEATDFCISDSTFENMVYRETHWPEAEILEYGHPRNDLLCKEDGEEKSKLRTKIAEELGFSVDDKVLIYAPTFRDSGTLDCYDVDFGRLVKALETRFGGTWKILMRLHFHDRKKKYGRIDDENMVVDATQYLDMQELLSIADAGLTDYSSWCCDYVLTGRPCFIYATDIERYNTERGLYYPLEETPFPIAKNNDDLERNVLGFDECIFEKKRIKFLNDRGCFEDGHAAERVVEKFKSIIE